MSRSDLVKGGSVAVCRKGLVQLFAAVRLLVQPALTALHHVNEIGQRLLLVHRNVPEVTTDRLSQLGFVESGAGLQLVVSLVASQCVDLQLEQVHLWDLHVVVGRLPSVVAGFPLPLVANALDEVLVKIADVEVSHTLVDIQLQLLLRDALLDPLAEGGIPSGPAAALTVRDQAAALAVERRGWRAIVAVLLRAEPVHGDARLFILVARP